MTNERIDPQNSHGPPGFDLLTNRHRPATRTFLPPARSRNQGHRMHPLFSRSAWFVLLAALLFAGFPQRSVRADPPAGALEALTLETGRTTAGGFTLSGREAGQQLLVTGRYAGGEVRDLTREVAYEMVPPGIVAVDRTGYVTA